MVFQGYNFEFFHPRFNLISTASTKFNVNQVNETYCSKSVIMFQYIWSPLPNLADTLAKAQYFSALAPQFWILFIYLTLAFFLADSHDEPQCKQLQDKPDDELAENEQVITFQRLYC